MTYAEWQAEVATAGGTSWVEHVHIQGQPAGGVKGSHVVFGGEIKGRRFLSDPQPLTSDPGDPEFAAVMAGINLQNETTIAELTAERDALGTKLEAREIIRQKQVDDLTREIAEKLRVLDDLTEPTPTPR